MTAARATDWNAELAKDIGSLSRDPVRFVMYAFPWGQKGGPLADQTGPRAWQVKILQAVGQGTLNLNQACREAVASGHGIGKAHPLDQLVPTPTGPRRWEDIEAGDLVFGANGKPTSVSATETFDNVPMYRVTFDDRSSCVVSSGHLWNVRGRQERRNGKSDWRTLETIDLVEMGVKRSNGSAEARQWEIPVQGAAQFDEREIELHPYFVGLWLGDGCKGAPKYTKPYPEVTAKMRKLGYEVISDASAMSHYVRGVKQLMTDDVFGTESHERWIPDDFKFNTVENRKALLCGLLDSDGECTKAGSIGFSSTSKRLADDVLWLARSLGCKATAHPTVHKPTFTEPDGKKKQGRDSYRLTINAPFNPFSIAHKRDRYKATEQRYVTRWIDSIEEIGYQLGKCIQVAAADGLYQVGDFIVTHNSALVSWLILWAMATCPDTRGVVTANTEAQLKTKTWAELAKWYRLCICKHWFTMTATALFASDPRHEKTWRIDMTPWSERNTEAFAGLHNQGRRILVIFDEASAIPDIIWETTEGALTDEGTEIIWAVFGNPTRNTGRFRECFGRFRHRWDNHQIDSRTVPGTNTAQLAQWVEDYGEDSDFVRVRVRGVFPRAGSMQFIGSDLVEAAKVYEFTPSVADPMILGVDVARFGDDQTVIFTRKGRDARTVAPIKLRGADTMQVAAQVAQQYRLTRADAIFVDEGGVGAGVVDRLRQMNVPVIGVQFGAKADGVSHSEQPEKFANKRAEMWGNMRQALKAGLAIPSDPELESDLTSPEYGFNASDEIQLERKEHMKARGLSSPDLADALALTFAYPVMAGVHGSRDFGGGGQRGTLQSDFNPF